MRDNYDQRYVSTAASAVNHLRMTDTRVVIIIAVSRNDTLFIRRHVLK